MKQKKWLSRRAIRKVRRCIHCNAAKKIDWVRLHAQDMERLFPLPATMKWMIPTDAWYICTNTTLPFRRTHWAAGRVGKVDTFGDSEWYYGWIQKKWKACIEFPPECDDKSRGFFGEFKLCSEVECYHFISTYLACSNPTGV